MKNEGFTLLELIVALALSTALLTAVLGITSLMTRQVQLGKEREVGAMWLSRLESQIRSDLDAATSYEQTRNSLVLIGYGAKGRSGGSAIQRPARIEYRITKLEERNWLTRTEFHLDQLTNLSSKNELCCDGVSNFQVRIPNEAQSEHNLGRIPRNVELVLHFAESKHVIRYARF